MIVHCPYDKLVPIHELKKHPDNVNEHPADQIKDLAEILKYQGWRYCIKISKQTGYITSGHGRLMAALFNQWTEVPVNYQDYESYEQEYSDVQSDNALAMRSQMDIERIKERLKDLKNVDPKMLGIKDFILDGIIQQIPGCDEDEVPEVKESICKLGDIWQLGSHRLMCGDSTSIDAVEKLMNGEKADMVFTDPPYGVDVVKSGMVGAEFGVAKKGHYKEIIGDDTTVTANEFYQACLSAGFTKFILWGGNYFTDFLAPSKSWVIWNKRGDTSISNTFADGEMAWSNLGHPVRIHGQLWNGMIRAGEKDKRLHPTQKPIALAEFCFDLLKDCKNIFDGFGGSGSTLIACEKTRRECFMMEIDPHYCDVIIARWEKYTGQKALQMHGTASND